MSLEFNPFTGKLDKVTKIGDSVGASSGSVLFAGTSGELAEDNANFKFFDAVNTLWVANANNAGNYFSAGSLGEELAVLAKQGYYESSIAGLYVMDDDGETPVSVATFNNISDTWRYSPYLTITSSASAFSNNVTVPDEVYGASWNGSLEVPTKNALYDKIETLSSGGASEAFVVAMAAAL